MLRDNAALIMRTNYPFYGGFINSTVEVADRQI